MFKEVSTRKDPHWCPVPFGCPFNTGALYAGIGFRGALQVGCGSFCELVMARNSESFVLTCNSLAYKPNTFCVPA